MTTVAPCTTSTPPTPPADARPPDPEPRRAPLRDRPQAQPIDSSSFRSIFESLVPNSDEMKWASIPWQTDLWEARKLAAQAEKPIFAWMMNGNPLGCV
jgi:hypothetical protein